MTQDRWPNALFAMPIAHAIRTGCGGRSLYREIARCAEDMEVDETLLDTVVAGSVVPPDAYFELAGWVLVETPV